METILGRFRNLIVLAAILFAQIVGLAIQVKRPAQQGDTRLIRVWAVSAITPFEKAVISTQNFFYNGWHNYVYLRGVRRENRELRAQLDQMKLEQVRLREDAEMARRMQSLLAFKEQHIDTTVAAQVIGTSGSDQSRVLYIDKGSSDGIRTDMAVITPNGIVGKVVQVFPDSAQVLPINDQLSGVGVMLQNTRLQGILRGASNGTTTVQYVMADERVVPGEELITSGGDRIFPKGLPVGKVVEVTPGKDLFLNIRVVPSAQIDRLEEVLVVTNITELPPDVKDLGPIRASDILARRLPTVPDKTPVDAGGNAIATPGAAPTQGATPNALSPAPNTAATGTATPRATTPGAAANRPGGTLATPRSTAGAGSTGTASTGTTPHPSTGTAKPGATNSATGVNGSAAVAKKPAAGTTAPVPATGGTSPTTRTQAPTDNATPKPKPRKPPEDNPDPNATTVHAASGGRSAAMTTRAMPFRGSLTSRDQVAVYEFPWPVILFVPLAAVAIQAFLPVRVRFFPILDLPMMVVIFFAVARRNPISGCLTGAIIGLLQDTLAGPAHPIGMYGIADTIIGFAASSLGVKIDVENHGTRFLITYLFFVAHQGIYFGVAHGLLRQTVQWSWPQVAISALVNAFVGMFVYSFLDRFKQR